MNPWRKQAVSPEMLARQYQGNTRGMIGLQGRVKGLQKVQPVSGCGPVLTQNPVSLTSEVMRVELMKLIFQSTAVNPQHGSTAASGASAKALVFYTPRRLRVLLQESSVAAARLQ